jgi:cytochrome P450 family 3 subfamily A
MLSITLDDQWKRIQAIVSPTFSTGKLRKMRPLIDDCLKTLIKNFNQLLKDEKEIDMKRVFGAFTMEVVIQVAFGTKVDALIDENNQIIMNAKKILSLDLSLKAVLKFLIMTTSPKIARLLQIRFIQKEVTQFFEEFTLKIVEERKKNKSSVKRYDFLQLLLDAMNNEQNDEEFENKVEKITEHDKIFEEQKFVTHNKSNE